MNSNINYSLYNRDNYLAIFERLRHRDGAAPPPNRDQEEQYLKDFETNFLIDMRGLATNDRQTFNRILGIVGHELRGKTELKKKMLEIVQSGGNVEQLYKQKYLKYKQKYTELKVQIGGEI
jgi:hypothetical protein